MNKGKATKRPVEVDYFKWEGNENHLEQWHGALEKRSKHFTEDFAITELEGLKVITLEGNSYSVPEGYIIIRGVQGEYYPCEPSIFFETYKLI
jgi:hypothetical protein